MRVVVDFDLCESNAICMGIAPEVFEVRDDLLALLDDIIAQHGGLIECRSRPGCTVFSITLPLETP